MNKSASLSCLVLPLLRAGACCLMLGAAAATSAADGMGLSGLTWPQGDSWRWRQEPMFGRGPAESDGMVPGWHGRLTTLLLGDAYRRPAPRLDWLGPQWEGSLRASTGVMLTLDLPGAGWRADTRPDRDVYALPSTSLGQAADSGRGMALWPYLGVGYTGLSRRSGWGFSADFGLIARPASSAEPADGGSRLDAEIGRLRLNPLLRLGLSYRF